MGIKYRLPQNANAPKTRALVDRLQQKAHAPNFATSDSDLRDTALGELITIVAQIEADVEKLKSAD
ncbi:hypothetical protein MAUB1S_01520 [Mycolicibacterium aubagnense]